ncbi:MAG: Hsp20/alpha crystallin family protein [bacterium]|nr:Hsp20/alpha crystallin family protein [bacterium]
MTSFFEKLKKGMSIKEPLEEMEETKEDIKKSSAKKPAVKNKAKEEKAASAKASASQGKEKKLDIKTISIEIKSEPSENPPPVIAKEPLLEPAPLDIADSLEKKPAFVKTTAGKENWFEQEGELAIDVYQTEQDLVIQSAVAGINPENIDIAMEKDTVTIKGFRKNPIDEKGDYFTQECFWGHFKREIILPVEVDPGFAEAVMKEGVLTIRLPKILREKKQVIKVKS